MRPRSFAALVLALFLVLVATLTSAEEVASPLKEVASPLRAFSFSIDQHTWISSGRSEFSIAGPMRVPDVLSELKWTELDSVVVEFSGTARYLGDFIPKPNLDEGPLELRPEEEKGFGFHGFALHVVGGFGAVTSGMLRDKDYRESNRRQLYSDTLSQLDGGSVSYADADSMHYAKVDFGFRVMQWSHPADPLEGFLEVSAGFGLWEEAYDAKGITDLRAVKSPAMLSVEPTTLTISESFLWKMLRVGMRGRLPLSAHFSLSGEIVVLPWLDVKIVDVHHLRTDLLKDPSATLEGQGGWGVEVDAMLRFRLGLCLAERFGWSSLRGTSLQAGYRYWYVESGTGTGRFHTTKEGTLVGYFNGARSKREGAIVGLEYRF